MFASRGGVGYIIKVKEGQTIGALTMGNLADSMEYYLKKLLALSASGFLEIKRKELAVKFNCVPSQVNYVLATRFTLDQGYIVESRRGGKGYLRIRKVDTDGWELPGGILQELQGPINPGQAVGIIERLLTGKYISMRESRLMEAALECISTVEDDQLQGELRGLLFRRMVQALFY